MRHFILADTDDARAVQFTKGLEAWAEWMGRNVSRTKVALTRIGRASVSTRFVGYDNDYLGTPHCWETVILGPVAHEELRLGEWRHPSLADAKRHHAEVCETLSRGLALPPESGPEPLAARAIKLGGGDIE